MAKKSMKIRTIIELVVVAELLCLALFLHINRSAFSATINSHSQSCYPKTHSKYERSSQSISDFSDLKRYPSSTEDSSLKKLIASGRFNNNAAFLYLKASSELILPDDFGKRSNDIISNGWSDDHKDLEEILVKNKDPIKEFRKASELHECDFAFSEVINAASKGDAPPGCDGEINYLRQRTDDGKTPYCDNTDLARLIVMECKFYERQGKLDSALDNYVSLFRLIGHLTRQKHATLVNKLIGRLVQNLAYSSLVQHINHNKLNVQHYRALLDALFSLKKNRTDFKDVLEVRNEEFKEVVKKVADEMRSSQAKQKWVNFYQEFYSEYDRLVDEFSEYWLAAFRENNIEKFEQKSRQFRERVEKETTLPKLGWNFLKKRMGFEATASPVLSARIFFSRNRPMLLNDTVYTRRHSIANANIVTHYTSISNLNVLTTVIAVKLYELKNSKLPDSLNELVPAYLPELPKDPFDDFKPLKYEKRDDKKWVIYSFGPDKKDNHASIRYNKASDDKTGDIVFSSLN